MRVNGILVLFFFLCDVTVDQLLGAMMACLNNRRTLKYFKMIPTLVTNYLVILPTDAAPQFL